MSTRLYPIDLPRFSGFQFMKNEKIRLENMGPEGKSSYRDNQAGVL
jgi:hypothetical protein